MSSQHLEEADELADRICIMTKGKLLALDTPLGIKKQFGFGYKLLISPKSQAHSAPMDFGAITKDIIEPLVLSAENIQNGFSSN
jgi:ABC-type multidrug transport system ATPase subunit